MREWHISANALRPGRVWTAPTLEDARLLIPIGFICLGRASVDDPVIVETWV